jgi:hypothetical protein
VVIRVAGRGGLSIPAPSSLARRQRRAAASLGRSEGHGHLAVAGPLTGHKDRASRPHCRPTRTTSPASSTTSAPRRPGTRRPAVGHATGTRTPAGATRSTRTPCCAAAPTSARATTAIGDNDTVLKGEGTAADIGGATPAASATTPGTSSTTATTRRTGASIRRTALTTGAALSTPIAPRSADRADMDLEHLSCGDGKRGGHLSTGSWAPRPPARIGSSGTTHTAGATPCSEGFDGDRSPLGGGIGLGAGRLEDLRLWRAAPTLADPARALGSVRLGLAPARVAARFAVLLAAPTFFAGLTLIAPRLALSRLGSGLREPYSRHHPE